MRIFFNYVYIQLRKTLKMLPNKKTDFNVASEATACLNLVLVIHITHPVDIGGLQRVLGIRRSLFMTHQT